MLSVLGKALIVSMGNSSTIHRLAVIIVNDQMQTSSRRTFSLFLDPRANGDTKHRRSLSESDRLTWK